MPQDVWSEYTERESASGIRRREMDFLQKYLMQNPEAAYQASIPSGGRMGQYWSRNYQPVYGEYTKAMAQNPRLQFTEFLGSYPWLQKYYGMSPSQRGDYSYQALTPKTRWLNY